MKDPVIRKEREKIESKSAYEHDLHEAIRDVRRAFANQADIPKIESCLNALFDISAPEIREAINDEWDRIDSKYREELELYTKAKNGVIRYDPKTELVAGKDGYVHHTTYLTVDDSDSGRFASLMSDIWDEILRERFRACINCLDRHGELRKSRDIDYGGFQ